MAARHQWDDNTKLVMLVDALESDALKYYDTLDPVQHMDYQYV